MRGRVTRTSADGNAAGAHARDCVEPCNSFRMEAIKLRRECFVKWIPYIVWIDCLSEPLDGRSKDRDFDIIFKRKGAGGFRKCVGFRKLKLRQVEIKVRVAFWGETHSLQNYYFQFTSRRQKFGEDIASLGSDLERLSQLACPECSQIIRDKIACAQFVSALSDRKQNFTIGRNNIFANSDWEGEDD